MAFGFRNGLRASAGAAALLIGAGSALAGGFALREQSTEGLGNAFAGSAAGGAGLGSMFWNPATITDHAGWQSSWNLTAIIPNANLKGGPGTGAPALGLNSTDFAPSAILGSSYTSYQLNDKLWLGLQTGAPYGLTTKHPVPWAGQVTGLTSRVLSAEVVPTLGYKVNDFISFGVGVRAQYFKVSLSNALAPAAAPPIARLGGDSYAFGYTLGVTLKPGPNTEIGIGYRSQTRPNLEGTIEGLTPAPNGIKANLVLPDQITVGLRHRLNQQWTMLAGYEWTRWSVFSSFPVVSTGPFIPPGVAFTTLPFQWRNGWYASLGTEYQYNDRFKVRAGIGYESSPITNFTRAVRLPDNNRTWLTAGFSYQHSQKISIDVGYAHIFVRPTLVAVVPGNPNFAGLPYVGSAKAHFDIFSVGLNYRWDDPAPAVVAKY